MPPRPLAYLRDRLSGQLQQVRLRLAHPDAQLQLAVLGLVTGLLAGAVIVLFRLGVEGTQALMLPGEHPENYEALAPWLRLLLPTLGGLAIGLLFLWTARGEYLLGVARIMERLAFHQGYLSLREFMLQFAGAALAIATGHSVGREGPHIFLGAASGSLLGQRLSLPNNAIRTLVACGTAAGISASFNTPLAGVIFALEVVMMEYSLASFVPIILAAVSADAVSILVLGAEPAFLVPRLQMGSLAEMPLVLLLGMLVGTVAAGFIQLLESIGSSSRNLPFWQRTTVAGLLVGCCGLLVPEILGIGYDTVDQTLLGTPGILMLLGLALFKVLATGFSIGLGIPGGLIGPSLFIGSVVGCLAGKLVLLLWPGVGSDVGFYALLGMGAMMGASLQAPLAALTAMMELTHNPQIIMPGMLAIVVAGLTSRELFGKDSVFVSVLKARGLRLDASPALQALRRAGVASMMETRLSRQPRRIGREQAKALLQNPPEWILVEGDGKPLALLRALDLALALEQEALADLDLMEIPGRRLQLAPVHLQATLQEALEQLERTGAEALYVERMTAPGIKPIFGVLTREQVESAYRP
jgi:H+/Cl- antiporter ClcA